MRQPPSPTPETAVAFLVRAIAQILMGRIDGALKDLSYPTVGNQHEAPLWRAVVAHAKANGYAATHLSIRGWGKTRPIADNATEEGRSQNRRVAIIVTAL